MLSSSRDVLLKMSETASTPKLFPSDCITLYLPEYEVVVYPEPAVLRRPVAAPPLLPTQQGHTT